MRQSTFNFEANVTHSRAPSQMFLDMKVGYTPWGTP